MYKIVVTMTFAWPQLSFSKDTTLFQGGFIFHWFLSFFKDISLFQGPCPFQGFPRKVLILHAKEGQPAVAQPLLAGLSLHAASKKLSMPFPRLWGLTWQHMLPEASPSYPKPLALSTDPFFSNDF